MLERFADPDEVTSATTKTLYFYASESNASFECRLDGNSWSACSAPVEYTGLAAGRHTFEVTAVDGLGNRDLSPAARSWTVQTTPGAVTITDGAGGIVVSPKARFSFTGTGSGFECRLDGGAWQPCTSPTTYNPLPAGLHQFAVRTTDNKLPATQTWTNMDQPAGVSTSPVLSRKGRYLAYESSASDLVAGDTNRTQDVFLQDRATLEIGRVSISPSGEQFGGPSSNPSISSDGRFVAFEALTYDVDPDGNRVRRVFVHESGIWYDGRRVRPGFLGHVRPRYFGLRKLGGVYQAHRSPLR